MRLVRTSQPQQPVGIDWGNPITRGIVGGISATSNNFLRIERPLPKGTGFSQAVAPNGKTIGCGSVGGTSLVLPIITNTSSITMLQVGSVNSGVADESPFSLSHNGNSSTFSITEGDGANAGRIRGNVYIGSYLRQGGSVTLPVGAPYVAVLRHINGTGQTLFLNGIRDTVTTSGTGASVGNTYYGSYSATFKGLLNIVWNRALSDAEIKSLSDNPWQIFQPVNRPIFVPVAGGSPDGNATGTLAAVTLTAATGNATGNTNGNATGSLAAITQTPATGAATGTATASGTSPTVTLTAATGSAIGTTSGNGDATGALSALGLTAATGNATGNASTSGSLSSVSLTAATGTASSYTDGNAFGAFMALVLTPVTGVATGTATASGTVRALGLDAATGNAFSAETPIYVPGAMAGDRMAVSSKRGTNTGGSRASRIATTTR